MASSHADDPDPRTAKKNIFEVDVSSMRANKVDHVSSMLTSLLVMVALGVIILGGYFIMQLSWDAPEEFHFEPERIAGRGDNAPGFERDFDPPAVDEIEQIAEPATESSLQLISQSISNAIVAMETIEGAANASSGRGDSRQAGPEGEGDDSIPRPQRWDLKFQARDRKGYANQLDFFKIELGAYGGTIPTVDYASNVSSNPTKRTGAPKDDKRLYFISVTEGVLKQYDRQILQDAGISLGSRVPLKFIPKELEEALAYTEAKHYNDNFSKEVRISNIAKTVFECRPAASGKGFEFVVIDQRYRNNNRK